ATPSVYTIQFGVSGGNTTYTVLEDGIAMPSATGLAYKGSQSISVPGRGMSVNIAGSPADGDTFTLQQSNNNLSLFNSLDKAIAGLNNGTLNNGQVQQIVNSGISQMDSISGNLQQARSSMGETLNRMDGIESRIASLKLIAQTDRSAAEDLDMVKAISDFQNKQTGYDAALKSYAMVQKLTLFQYING
ncbi:MAG: flagellar hook protein, partial [Pseudomonadota bacterium]